ncbi:MAG: Radical SAM domain protein, partial [candidate division CPR2 bacterium GW2011_GWD1_39_7]
MRISRRTIKFDLGNETALLLNSTSGTIDIIPNKLLKNPSSDTIKKLTERGHLLTKDREKTTLIRLTEIAKNHGQNIPYWFYILTTLRCNFNCPICYEKSTHKTKDLNLATLKKIIKSIEEIQKTQQILNKRMFIVLFGGEPLCGNKEVIENILKECKRRQWKVVIVTNGSLVKKYAKIFRTYRAVISDFRITLDGPKHIHNQRRPQKNNLETFSLVEDAIDNLLKERFTVKMQTILGNGNEKHLKELAKFLLTKNWFQNPNYQWRIEGSHDYANLDPQKDEISEGEMVKTLIDILKKYPEISAKIKFESFKYLGHIVNSFEWLGTYKTYWGPKYGFCEPQKGYHFVFSTDGKIFHCPRTVNNKTYLIGTVNKGLNSKSKKYKKSSVLEKQKCKKCALNTFCGGGCAVQKVC